MLSSTSSQARNISGYLSGLSSPSATEETITRASSPIRNSAGQTRLPTFSTISRSSSSSGSAGSAERTMFGVEVALAAEAAVGVELDDRHVQRGEPVGVEAALHVALEHADAHVAELAQHPLEHDVLPAPGALIRLTTVTPARSKSARLAAAIVVLASSASSTTGPSHGAFAGLLDLDGCDLELLAGLDRHVRRPAAGQRKSGRSISQRARSSSQRSAAGTTSWSSRAPSQTVSRATSSK